MNASRLALASALTALAGCSSPLGGQDLDLALAAHALPGVGGGVGLSQRMGTFAGQRLDFEIALMHQELSEAGPRGDDWDQIWGGLRLGALERDGLSGTFRAGVTWLRVEGDPEYLDDPGDYGGLYAGAGLEWPVSAALSTGPEATVSAVDSEGSKSGAGLTGEIAWRLVWHL